MERRTTLVILAGGTFGLLGGMLAVLLFTTAIASRIGRLVEEARDVAAGRPIAHEVRGNDEIAVLERTLQETSELLSARAEQLRKVHGDLELRVAQRTAELTAANEELRTSNEVRQAVVQSSPLAIWALDLNGNVTFWNPAAERIFGWTEAEVIGRPLPVIADADQEEHRDWIRRFAAGESFSGSRATAPAQGRLAHRRDDLDRAAARPGRPYPRRHRDRQRHLAAKAARGAIPAIPETGGDRKIGGRRRARFQ